MFLNARNSSGTRCNGSDPCPPPPPGALRIWCMIRYVPHVGPPFLYLNFRSKANRFFFFFLETRQRKSVPRHLLFLITFSFRGLSFSQKFQGSIILEIARKFHICVRSGAVPSSMCIKNSCPQGGTNPPIYTLQKKVTQHNFD